MPSTPGSREEAERTSVSPSSRGRAGTAPAAKLLARAGVLARHRRLAAPAGRRRARAQALGGAQRARNLATPSRGDGAATRGVFSLARAPSCASAAQVAGPRAVLGHLHRKRETRTDERQPVGARHLVARLGGERRGESSEVCSPAREPLFPRGWGGGCLLGALLKGVRAHKEEGRGGMAHASCVLWVSECCARARGRRRPRRRRRRVETETERRRRAGAEAAWS